ncbi:hypothetical protein GIB67_015105 [Kingdonia uniflora]|uniref:NAC domain-containing protein n=1 Tax=Kingdonia uniflora TaxID=39325 RepID=A0A7J7LJ79_9MAGN|nr:hypothetical protein GIB67_015105 [Kingdonia uniflora]
MSDFRDGTWRENKAIVGVNSDHQVEEFIESFPPGYIFEPTDKQLVKHYLLKRASGHPLPLNIFRDVALYNFQPEELAAAVLVPLERSAVQVYYLQVHTLTVLQ